MIPQTHPQRSILAEAAVLGHADQKSDGRGPHPAGDLRPPRRGAGRRRSRRRGRRAWLRVQPGLSNPTAVGVLRTASGWPLRARRRAPRSPPGGEPVDPPRRRPGGRRAVLRGQRGAGRVDPGRPPTVRPTAGGLRDHVEVVDRGRVTVHSEVELRGRDRKRAAWIPGQVASLPGRLAGGEVEEAGHPQRPDAREVRRAVGVRGGQPAPVVGGVRPGQVFGPREPGLHPLPVDERQSIQFREVLGVHAGNDRAGGRESSAEPGEDGPRR